MVKVNLIGEEVEIVSALNKTLKGLKGKVIDETKQTISIEAKERSDVKKVLKKEVKLRINTTIIDGRDLVGRPEERLKKKGKSETKMVIKIGNFEVKDPVRECSEVNCPFHGSLSVRGRTFSGTVKSDKMHKTVTVEWERIIKIPKYNRYMVKKSKVKAHNPRCIKAKTGDKVLIAECRPLSKTKKFVVLEVIKE